MIRRTFLKGAFATAALMSVSPSLASASQKSIRVYLGGPIFTMNSKNEIVEALAIKDDIILAVGKKDDVLKAAGPEAEIVDLKGRMLMPGMIDGHSHFPVGATRQITMVNLNVPPLGEVSCIADMQRLLKQRASETEEGKWVVGYNYNDLAMKEQRHPTRADLDAVSTKHPVFVRHVSGHLGVANSVALELAGITESTPDPEGARFRRGPDGKLDGVLEGPAAHYLVGNLIPATTPELHMRSLAMDSMTYAAAGITTANNGGSPSIDQYILKASETGDLKIRVVIWPNGRKPQIVASYGDKRQGTQLDKKGMVYLGPVKL